MDRKDIQFYVGLAVSLLTLIVLSYNLKRIMEEEKHQGEHLNELEAKIEG